MATALQNALIESFNEAGRKKQTFSFIINFDKSEFCLFPQNEPAAVLMAFPDTGTAPVLPSGSLCFIKSPPSYPEYWEAFWKIQDALAAGNSYLANLTFSTPIRTNLSLAEIYRQSNAPYKLLWPQRFAVFSPESFVQIRDNRIYTYPMKGTADAQTEENAALLLADEKEKAEHVTVVDLLRNDLNLVSKNVRVERFRYLEKIRTHEGSIYQTSSCICGDLDSAWPSRLGTMLDLLLPAGSVTGAPKRKTIEIIRKAEKHTRGFYTGIFGQFNGESLDSAVMIRFIEQTEQGLVFKSGGGITIYSDPYQEYLEMIRKVYVPIY